MDWKTILIAGILAGIIGTVVVGNALYMNSIIRGVYEEYKDLPVYKPQSAFGGQANWIAIMLGGGVAFSIFAAFVYALIHPSIPGRSWRKGLVYGACLGLLREIPATFNNWLMFAYPDMLIAIELANGIIITLVACVVIAVVFEKFKTREKY